MRLLSRQFIPVLAGAIALIAAPAASAQADTVSSLPQLTGFDQMVVDSSANHVFLSEGGGGKGIVVTDLSGTYQTTLDTGDNVDGLALSSDGSTLYAAVAGGTDAGKVANIAVSSVTSTLSQTFYSLATATDLPYRLALQSGQLWVSYNDGSGGAIGAINPGTGTFTANAASGTWSSAPMLAADPQDSGVLVAGRPNPSTAQVASYNVTTIPATTNAQTTQLSGDCLNLHQLAVVPGGAQFIPACGAPHVHDVYSTTDLSLQGSYTTTSYPDAVAIAGNGTVAAGVDNTADTAGPSIFVYSAGGTTPLNTINFGSSSKLAYGGLAWSADGSTLYAVVSSGSSYSLIVYDNPTQTGSTLTLNGSATSYTGRSVTLTGSLSLASGVAPGATPITVSRTPAGGTATPLPSVTTATDGSFTITDTPPATGSYTYTVSYAGDTTTAAATASHTVTVSLIGSRLSLSGPSQVVAGRTYTLSGKLALSTGNPPTGTPIAITRTKPGTGTMHWTVKTASNGSFSLTTKPPALGTYTYAVKYAGNATTRAAAATRTVTITKLPVALGITTSKSSMNYEATVKVTAHLGKTYSNRTVAIYARSVGSSKNVLLKRGRVNSSGYLSVSYRAAHSTMFRAVFTGDARYQSRTVTRTTGVRARIATNYTGYYTTTRAGGYTFHIYHQTAQLNVAITVAPNKHGECVELQVQEFYSNAWHTNVTTGCGYLSSSSKTYGYLTLGQADLGYPYRVRVKYLRKSSDQSNLNTQSGWFYFAVVN